MHWHLGYPGKTHFLVSPILSFRWLQAAINIVAFSLVSRAAATKPMSRITSMPINKTMSNRLHTLGKNNALFLRTQTMWGVGSHCTRYKQQQQRRK